MAGSLKPCSSMTKNSGDGDVAETENKAMSQARKRRLWRERHSLCAELKRKSWLMMMLKKQIQSVVILSSTLEEENAKTITLIMLEHVILKDNVGQDNSWVPKQVRMRMGMNASKTVASTQNGLSQVHSDK